MGGLGTGSSGLKIATFNVNSIRKRLPIVLQWLKRNTPDVFCLQETKVQDCEFPLSDFGGSGYHVTFRGMKSYNGVAVLSRSVPKYVSYGFDDGGEPDEARLIRAMIDGITIVNTYIPQGASLDSPKYSYKLEWYKRLRVYFSKHLSNKKPVIWCGDMNVAPEPIDVDNAKAKKKHVCFHEDVRREYQETLAWGFTDVFRKLHPDKLQYTFWDYRQPNTLIENRGWRVDHILATPSLVKKCIKAEVDVKPRNMENPSDHTVMWAEF